MKKYQLTWLTSSPLLRGTWVAVILSLAPIVLAVLSLATALDRGGLEQEIGLFSSALFLSVSAILIQFPAFQGRIELDDENLVAAGRLSGRRGRLQIPREALTKIYLAPPERPPNWVPFVWGIGELTCLVGAVSAGAAEAKKRTDTMARTLTMTTSRAGDGRNRPPNPKRSGVMNRLFILPHRRIRGNITGDSGAG